MPTYQQTIADNLRYLQRQIDRINTAQMGPVTIAAGDGSMKMLGTDGGEVFSFNEDGMFFLHRGSRRNMSVFSDNVVSWLERHDGTLDSHDSRISTAQSEADRANTRLDGVGITLGKHDERIANAGAMAGAAQADADRANNRLDGVGITLGKHDDRIANAGAMAGAAQDRADSAYARAGTGISNAATAKDRADSAYALAASKASSSTVSDLNDYVRAQIARLDRRIDNLPGA